MGADSLAWLVLVKAQLTMRDVRAIRKALDRRANLMLAAGAGLSVLWNLRRWRRDRALAIGLGRASCAPVSLIAMPKVSVLVPAWNESAMICAHIEGFERLRYPNKQMVLCAGGDDGTYELAAGHADRDVRVIRQAPGEGKQAALQRCLEQSDGSVIYLVDADVLLTDDAFEGCLAPIINDREMVVTGRARPLASQLSSAYVLHRWFTDLYAASRTPDYTTGLLGSNCALRRDALEKVGSFRPGVRTGTDYHLAKRLLLRGYRIRLARDSVVETRYALRTGEYWQRQSRWLRNVVLHGIRFGAYGEAWRGLAPSAIGTIMLAGALPALRSGGILRAGWALAWSHAIMSRLRYMRFGELVSGRALGPAGYAAIPLYVFLDFGVWALTLAHYPFARLRSRW